MRMVPSSGVKKRASARRRLVLPEPLGPSKAQNDPAATWIDTPSSTTPEGIRLFGSQGGGGAGVTVASRSQLGWPT
jgi:hypothetical protein